jgi:hypothetical protein
VLLETEIESITPAGKYDNSIEALCDLLKSYHVTDISTSLSHLANGIQYSFVEVTCSDGIQYGLQAYGDEASELNRIALEHQLRIEQTLMVVP